MRVAATRLSSKRRDNDLRKKTKRMLRIHTAPTFSTAMALQCPSVDHQVATHGAAPRALLQQQ